MQYHRYAEHSIYGDYARAAFGLAVTVPPLLLFEPATFFVVLLSALAALFAWFAARTVLRHLRWVELTPEAIAVSGPLGRRMAWDELERVKLAYYAPRRDRQGGWLQLTLRGRGGPIKVDSNLEGFDHVAQRAARTAQDKGLELDPVTEANFAALGLVEGEAGDREATPPDPATAAWQAVGRHHGR